MTEIRRLEIGAGTIRKEGFMHHDIRELPGIDVVCDARKFPQELKGTFHEVHASNIIEHFNRFEVFKVLKEWYELLAPGGVITIITPDIEEITRQLHLKMIDIAWFNYLCYGSNEYEFNKHYYAFDTEHLAQSLEKLGAEIVQKKPGRKFEEKAGVKYCPMITVKGRRPLGDEKKK